MQTTIYKSVKQQHNQHTNIDDYLVVEAPIEININQSSFTVVMRTPGDDNELVRGLLFAEDIYRNTNEMDFSILENDKHGFTKVNVNISNKLLGQGYLTKRSLLSVSSCGICGKQNIEDLALHSDSSQNISSIDILDMNRVPEMYIQMKKLQKTFELTGGSHAAAIFNKKHELLTVKEDIGRHNAVDKCVGYLLNNNILDEGSFLFVSGRVSYEIISKAFFAKIKTIVAVSACSSLAVDYAKEFGICLIGFSRDGTSTIYANPHATNYNISEQ